MLLLYTQARSHTCRRRRLGALPRLQQDAGLRENISSTPSRFVNMMFSFARKRTWQEA